MVACWQHQLAKHHGQRCYHNRLSKVSKSKIDLKISNCHHKESLQNAPLCIGGNITTLSETVGISCSDEIIIRTIAGRNTIMNMPVIIEIWIKDEQLIQQHNESPGREFSLSLYFVFLCVIIFDRKPLAVLYLSSVSIVKHK